MLVKFYLTYIITSLENAPSAGRTRSNSSAWVIFDVGSASFEVRFRLRARVQRETMDSESQLGSWAQRVTRWSVETYAIPKPLAFGVLMAVAGLILVSVLILKRDRSLMNVQARSLEPPRGFVMPPLQGVDFHGQIIRVPFDQDGRPTLLFVFSTTCRLCELNWPAWQSLKKLHEAGLARIVYANISSPLTEDYLRRYDLDKASVFAELDPRVMTLANILVTPQTILLSPHGEVENVWSGVLTPEQLSEINNQSRPNKSADNRILRNTSAGTPGQSLANHP